MITDLWLVGQYVSGEVGSIVWDFQGVFSTHELAVAACVEDSYFVAPVILDQPLPKKTVEWGGVHYPRLETQP